MIIFKLKQLLEDRNMTMTELAETTGISRTSLSQLSNGRSQGIQFETLESISLALEVKPGKLFDMQITMSDYAVDFVAIRESSDKVFAAIIVSKVTIADKVFWVGVNVVLDFSSDDDSVSSTTYFARQDFLSEIVRKKYGKDVEITVPYETTLYVRKSFDETRNIILDPSSETSYFRNALAQTKLALSMVAVNKLELPKNKNRIVLEKEFRVDALSKETKNKISIDTHDNTLVLVSYEYSVSFENPMLYNISTDEPSEIKVETLDQRFDFAQYKIINIQ